MRLTGADGREAVGVVSIAEAMEAANEAGMDLVEISLTPSRQFVVWWTTVSSSSRRAKLRKGKKKSNGFRLRVKFRPGTDIGDYQVKLRNLTGFLEDGNKVKVTIRFRGREMAHQDIGVDVLNRLKADTEEFAVVEDLSQRELKVARWSWYWPLKRSN